MNVGLDEEHASLEYYDGDYPSPTGAIAENFDETTKLQGLCYDLEAYVSIADEIGGPILEACCGTGRVAIPLLRSGHAVTGVDISRQLLKMFEDKLTAEEPQIRERCRIVASDIAELNLERNFQFAIVAFNSLLIFPTLMASLRPCVRFAGILSSVAR